MLELHCMGKKGVRMSIQAPSPLMARRWTVLGAWDVQLQMVLETALYNAAALQNKKVLSNIRDAVTILHDGIYLNTILTRKKMTIIRKGHAAAP